MNDVRIKIITYIDGAKSDFSVFGKLYTQNEDYVLEYSEQNSKVRLIVGEYCHMTRQGDYSLSLCFTPGKRSKVEIGVGSSDGEIILVTEKYERKLTNHSLKIHLKYFFDFIVERQEMQLFLVAEKII